MIPAGLGMTGIDNKYIGAITIGFDIRNLTEKLRRSLKNDGIEFALLDENFKPILSSKEFPELEYLKENLRNWDQQPYNEIHIFDSNRDSFYISKIHDMPYSLYLKYNNKALQHDLWERLTSRFIEVAILAFVVIFISILIYNHEIKLRKEAEIAYEKAKKINEELEFRVKERTIDLERALQVKTDFLNNLSHEVRTPIQSATAFINGLVDQWDNLDNKEKFDIASKAKKSSDRLFSFVNDLLDISKISSGKMEFSMERTDLNNIITAVIDEMEILWKEKNLEIEFIRKVHPAIITCSTIKIGQVMRNLLANAIKFTSDGKISIISDAYDQENIIISVIDNGIGIPENEFLYIFEPFNQSSRTKTKAGGTGLGLSICREIILLHNGKIWAENNKGKGASFNFTLPLNNNIVDHKEKIATKISNILMIDDEVSCLEMMKIMLMGTGYNLMTEENGLDGLRYIEEAEILPDAILLDLMMPDIHGLDILKQIRNNPRISHLKVIIQSGVASEKEVLEANNLEALFIRKPYSKAEILTMLNNFSTQN